VADTLDQIAERLHTDHCVEHEQDCRMKADILSALQSLAHERDASRQAWEAHRLAREAEIDGLRKQLCEAEQERDTLRQIAGSMVVAPCQGCGKGWPHPSVLSTSPVCESCRHQALIEARADALRDAFLAGFQVGVNSVDRNGESDTDPEEALADWLRARATEASK
jgi:hypothetical protein